MKRMFCLILGLATIAVSAEDKPKPAFQNCRYDDSQVTREASLYYAPLRLSDASDVSVGAQLRVRGEHWENFLSAAPNDTDFLLTRLRINTDVRLYKGLRFYVEGISALSTERDLPGGYRIIDVDSADLLNAFGDLSTDLGGVDLTLRIGRQELQYGKQRLISPLDWVNTRRTFDGAKLIATHGDLRVDAFVTRLVQVQKYEFNDGDSGRDFGGVYASQKIAPWNATADVYWLRLDRDGAKYGGITGHEERDTIGARGAGLIGQSGYDYDVEGGYQFGDVGSADIGAGFFASQLGYTLPDSEMKPRLYLGYDYASGDDDPTDGKVGTFNQLFPLGHAYFGAIDLVGRQNISDISAGFNCALTTALGAKLEGHHFERADTHDALYDAGGNVVRPGDAGTSRDIGEEIDLVFDFKWDMHTSLQAGYAHFMAGEFMSQSGADEDADLIYAMAQYTL